MQIILVRYTTAKVEQGKNRFDMKSSQEFCRKQRTLTVYVFVYELC